MSRSHQIFCIIAGLMGFYGIAAGALAAHAVSDPMLAARINSAALYALIHAAVLVSWSDDSRSALLVKCIFVLGVLLFSGGMMLAYMGGLMAMSRVIPVGGTLLLTAWLGVGACALYSLRRH